jgi:tRNA (pseudouridine54-N1)-methyltransferase
MREFVYFSQSARTSGNFDSSELMKAGRMDIAIHSFIQGVFLSHGFRKDTIFHFVFYGQPDPPKHIEIQVKDDLEISKKDVGNLIKKILYKFKEGKKTEVFPGCFVERKSFLKLIEELDNDGKEIFILDKKGEDIRKAKIENDCVFILGDHEGLPKKEMKRLKEIATSVSIGNKMYFASQTVAVVNNELDYRGI